MQEEFEIELLDEQEEQQNELQLPMNYITVGEIENDDLKVYLHQDVFKRLEEFAASDLDHELGSILLGEYAQTMGKTHLIISDYIEAKYTDASASTLTFTHESWEYIHKQHEKEHPELRILGWQHTHPGYGVFLSNYDLFIQENFFNLPFQVAYVIDPKQKLRGFFQWKENKVEKLKGFHVYDDIGKPVKVDLSQPRSSKQEKQTKSGPFSPFTIVLLLIMAVLCGVTVLQSGKIRSQNAAQEELFSVVNRQGGEIRALQQQAARADTAESSERETEPETGVTFICYTVKSGDTLYGICQANHLDYKQYNDTIRAMNGIENADQIREGQVLILPKADQ